tara:strand:+ start:416 stop:814 length:399 start_codon:yes stop_codon:yes gene_type:complete
MADINLLAASSIVLKSARGTVEDDYAVTSSYSATAEINLGNDQAAKVISLVLRNTNSSTAYDIDVFVSANQAAAPNSYLYENYSIAADTTWIAVSPNTTGPIFLEEADEFRIGGSSGSEAYVFYTLSYELIT